MRMIEDIIISYMCVTCGKKYEHADDALACERVHRGTGDYPVEDESRRGVEFSGDISADGIRFNYYYDGKAQAGPRSDRYVVIHTEEGSIMTAVGSDIYQQYAGVPNVIIKELEVEK